MSDNIICPTCGLSFTEKEWNSKTKYIINNLNDNDSNIILIEDRYEGCLYRCPNGDCEDEVIVNSLGTLEVQE